MSIIHSDKNSCVWQLTSEASGDKYIVMHGDTEFISDISNVISAAQGEYPGQKYTFVKLVAGAVETFEFEA